MDSRGGGAERVLAQIVAEMAARGHQVSLLSFDAPDSPDFYPVDGRVHRIWLNAGRRHARTGVTDFLTRVGALRRTIRTFRPDVAIGFNHSAYVPLAFALAWTGIPVVGSEHTVRAYYAGRRLEWLALLAGARLYDRMTIVSEQAKASFPGLLGRRMVVIPNPVGANDCSPALANKRRNIVLNVGHISEPKDQKTLIAAFGRIADKHRDWKLRIVGEGDLRDRLEAQARELGIASRVELPGATREIRQEYAAARIFALSSAYESFGLATAEALAAGLPAIGFADCPGTNELIQHGVNGLLADPANRVAGMAAALDRLIGSPEDRERMAASAPASISRLSVEHVADRWEELLSQVGMRAV